MLQDYISSEKTDIILLTFSMVVIPARKKTERDAKCINNGQIDALNKGIQRSDTLAFKESEKARLIQSFLLLISNGQTKVHNKTNNILRLLLYRNDQPTRKVTLCLADLINKQTAYVNQWGALDKSKNCNFGRAIKRCTCKVTRLLTVS